MYFAYTVYDRLPLIRTTFNQSVGHDGIRHLSNTDNFLPR